MTAVLTGKVQLSASLDRGYSHAFLRHLRVVDSLTNSTRIHSTRRNRRFHRSVSRRNGSTSRSRSRIGLSDSLLGSSGPRSSGIRYRYIHKESRTSRNRQEDPPDSISHSSSAGRTVHHSRDSYYTLNAISKMNAEAGPSRPRTRVPLHVNIDVNDYMIDQPRYSSPLSTTSTAPSFRIHRSSTQSAFSTDTWGGLQTPRLSLSGFDVGLSVDEILSAGEIRRSDSGGMMDDGKTGSWWVDLVSLSSRMSSIGLS
jgi:hypothetical protein